MAAGVEAKPLEGALGAVTMQKFDGKWELTEELAKLLGIPSDKIKEANKTEQVNILHYLWEVKLAWGKATMQCILDDRCCH